MAQLVDQVWQVVGTMANKWSFLALLGIVLLFWFGYFARQKRRFAPLRTFDNRAEGFRPSEAGAILGDFERAGHLQAYLNQARGIDMLFPVFYSLLGAVSIYLAAPHLTGLRWLVLLPFAMALFDWLENFCVITLVGRYRSDPARLGSWPTMLFIAQRLKFLFMGATLAAIAVLSFGWARRKLG
jgi:hypothetical protein